MTLSVSQRRLVALGMLAVVVGVVGVRRLAHGAAAAPALQVAPVHVAAPAAHAAPRAAGIVVDVEGAVRRAGLVRLASGSRVSDAIARAGGLTARAERTAVNLAAPVSDGQQVLVPARGAGGGAVGGGGGAAAGPVSLSAATPEQLDALPGIGPVTAQKIVSFRQQHGAFHSVDELDAIPGIGPARIADLKGLVVP
jgi:competence protein ComEA